MKKFSLVLIIIVSVLIFAVNAGVAFTDSMNSVVPLSCISNHTLSHGSFTMTARYFFTLNKNKGVVRINGLIREKGNTYPISRQVFFNFIKVGDEYTFRSTSVERMSTDKGGISEAEIHLPSFFSYPKRKLNVEINQDRYNNAIFIFAEVPAFYCVRRDVFI